ncbi:hypothetical protein HRI_000791100 [Hibiscus trionum]|uniref:Uncharacterized protein n=1 Tax=Hibiscus trionum TaxID=183268 RepID=A0A9W7H5T4_HIBTR|nr:hypothetical protein HRI_000791100 [Hibiscus trionum]
MFGSPSIMCGGDRLLHQLGLPRSHVQAITMHRDIVPRAFSCNFPDHVAELLKAINGKLRHHPCLTNQKLLYAPMGQYLILQPDEKFSPHHHLLPSGTGLYFLSCPFSSKDGDEKLLRAALRVFFNSPHPLDILSDLTAYNPKRSRHEILLEMYMRRDPSRAKPHQENQERATPQGLVVPVVSTWH